MIVLHCLCMLLLFVCINKKMTDCLSLCCYCQGFRQRNYPISVPQIALWSRWSRGSASQVRHLQLNGCWRQTPVSLIVFVHMLAWLRICLYATAEITAHCGNQSFLGVLMNLFRLSYRTLAYRFKHFDVTMLSFSHFVIWRHGSIPDLTYPYLTLPSPYLNVRYLF